MITEFYHSTKQWQHSFDILNSFFSSDTHQSMETSDSDLKVNRNIYADERLDIYFRKPIGHYPTFSYSDECRTKKAFMYVKRLPLFRAVVKFCSTHRLFR